MIRTIFSYLLFYLFIFRPFSYEEMDIFIRKTKENPIDDVNNIEGSEFRLYLPRIVLKPILKGVLDCYFVVTVTGFWLEVGEQEKLDWMAKVDKFIIKYASLRSDGKLGIIAHFCVLVGVNFEMNLKF